MGNVVALQKSRADSISASAEVYDDEPMTPRTALAFAVLGAGIVCSALTPFALVVGALELLGFR